LPGGHSNVIGGSSPSWSSRPRPESAPPSAPLIWPSRIWSSLAICLGLWWWWQPQHYPFGPGDPGTFATLMGALPGAAVPAPGPALDAARRRNTLGEVAVVIAAVCALPYGLMRLTWLTPWALFGGSEPASSPEIRLHGLLLGFAALVGAILTTGLVARGARSGPGGPRWCGGGLCRCRWPLCPARS
jgi:hypothetical protein